MYKHFYLIVAWQLWLCCKVGLQGIQAEVLSLAGGAMRAGGAVLNTRVMKKNQDFYKLSFTSIVSNLWGLLGDPQ